MYIILNNKNVEFSVSYFIENKDNKRYICIVGKVEGRGNCERKG